MLKSYPLNPVILKMVWFCCKYIVKEACSASLKVCLQYLISSSYFSFCYAGHIFCLKAAKRITFLVMLACTERINVKRCDAMKFTVSL